MSYKNFVQGSEPPGAPYQPGIQTQNLKLTPQQSGLISRIGEQQDRYLQKFRDDQQYDLSRQRLPSFNSGNILSGKDQKGSGSYELPVQQRRVPLQSY